MKKIILAFVLILISFVSVQAQSVEQVSQQKIAQLEALHSKIQSEVILPVERKKIMLETIRDDISQLYMMVGQGSTMTELYAFEKQASGVHAGFMKEIMNLRQARIRKLQQKSKPQQRSFWNWF